jgi:hypothetical protein
MIILKQKIKLFEIIFIDKKQIIFEIIFEILFDLQQMRIL